MKTRVIESRFSTGDTVITRKSRYAFRDKMYKDFPAGSIGKISEIDIYADKVMYRVRLSNGYLAGYDEHELALVGIDTEEDDRPQCCKDHDVYGATCDTCDYGDGAEEDTEDNKLCTYEESQRKVTVEEVERLEEELRCARSEVADLKNLIIKLLFDRYGF